MKGPENHAGISERMNTMKCIDLLEGLSYQCLQGDVQTEVKAVVNDQENWNRLYVLSVSEERPLTDTPLRRKR